MSGVTDSTAEGDPRAHLRIAVHDYSGHPFQVQLSRSLARRGHEVLHLYSTAFQTPKGPLAPLPDDPPSFAVEGIDLGETFHKYSFVRRLFQERRYGGLLADRLTAFAPDVVISTNTPLDAQAVAQRRLKRDGIAVVFWLQDIYSRAIERMLRRRLPLIGGLLARRFSGLEARLLRESDAIVVITEDFLPPLAAWGVRADRISVIENWAPLDQLTPLPKDNPWSREHGLADVPVLMYAGTLGLKHDPSLLLGLAEGLPDAKVVVVSEGLGADWLREHGGAISNLLLLPFQPFDRLSEVLASADVLLAVLEPEAGPYSVPSKVLTSLAAGRPILASVPESNLAAKTIERVGAGMVVRPGDMCGTTEAGRLLIADPILCRAMGQIARAWAEACFDIEPITDRFEVILDRSGSHATLSDGIVDQGAEMSRQGGLTWAVKGDPTARDVTARSQGGEMSSVDCDLVQDEMTRVAPRPRHAGIGASRR
jgi:glycosyltransferase involved in cell wall biosynthesis